VTYKSSLNHTHYYITINKIVTSHPSFVNQQFRCFPCGARVFRDSPVFRLETVAVSVLRFTAPLLKSDHSLLYNIRLHLPTTHCHSETARKISSVRTTERTVNGAISPHAIYIQVLYTTIMNMVT